MFKKRKIIAASTIIFILILLKLIAPSIPKIVVLASDFSFGAMLVLLVVLLTYGLYRLVMILVNE